MMRTLFSVAILIALPSVAFADEKDKLPKGLRKTDSATSGSTDVAKEGFTAATEKPKDDKEYAFAKLTLGGLLAAGNARSVAVTASGELRGRFGNNVLGLDLAGNYGRAAKTGGPLEQTVGNFQVRGRYDRFLLPRLAAFASTSARYDKFQGLDLRLNIDPGVAYYFVDESDLHFWGELGYDFQFDVRNDAYIAAAAAGMPPQTVEKSQSRHAVRAFVGYQHALGPGVSLTSGLEYLQGIVAGSSVAPENFRLNWDVGILAKVVGELAVAVTIGLKYDNNPLPGVKNADAITALNLVYTLGKPPVAK